MKSDIAWQIVRSLDIIRLSGLQPTTFTGSVWTDGSASIKCKHRQTNSTIPSSFNEAGYAAKYLQKGAQLFSHSSSSTTITNPTTPATDGRSCQVTTAADQHPLGMPPIPPLSPFVAAFPADLSAKTTCDIRHSLLMA
ncbi:conserved hypothetical protein [Trichinella spiralis]|uniref:hypothetical protein n=1 Tax=Trichinella spiralis TaxID=6334 RepID=UPI0001EFBA74|nr:conserved hypothetical protein [Trichinella spiralis]